MAHSVIAGRYLLAKLKPWLRPYVEMVTDWLEENGIEGRFVTVYRSPGEQDRRFALGETSARAGESAHQYGLAFDFVVSQGEQSLQQRQLQAFWRDLGFNVIEGTVGKGVSDPAHVEVPNWRVYA